MTALLSGVTMRCQQDRGHIFLVIINNYLPKCESQVENACAPMGADITRKLTFRCNKYRIRKFCQKNGK